MHVCLCVCSWLEREGGSRAKYRSDNIATKISSSSEAIRTQESGRFEGLIKNWETQRKRSECGKNEMKGVGQTIRWEREVIVRGSLQRQELPTLQQGCHPDPQIKLNAECHTGFYAGESAISHLPLSGEPGSLRCPLDSDKGGSSIKIPHIWIQILALPVVPKFLGG